MEEITDAAVPDNMDSDVRFRLTAAEKKRLAGDAEAAGMSLSAYIRTSLLDGFERPVSVPKEGPARLRRVYLTDADWEALRYNAASAGLTASGFVREQCVGRDLKFDGHIPTEVLPSREDLDRLDDLLFELKRQGSNLNQIARRLNSVSDLDGEIAVLREHLSKLMDRIEDVIKELERRGMASSIQICLR